MKRIFLLLFLIVFACAAQQSYGQDQHKMDSLKTELKKATQDTIRLNLYLALADECDINDNLLYAQPAMELADKIIAKARNAKEKKVAVKKKNRLYIYFNAYYVNKNDSAKTLYWFNQRLIFNKEMNDTAGIAKSFSNISNYYFQSGNFPKGLDYYQKSMLMYKAINDKRGITDVLYSLVVLYEDQGDHIRQLEKLKEVLLIQNELKDTIGITNAEVNIGNAYGSLHDLKNAIIHFNKGIALYEAIKSKAGLRWAYNCLGLTYKDNNEPDKALEYLNKAMLIAEEMNDTYWVAVLLNNMGGIYVSQKEYEKALDYRLKALKINEGLRDESRITWSYHGLAETYFGQGNYKKAKEYSLKSIERFKKIPNLKSLRDFYLLASQIDSASGNGSDAYKNYKQYILLREKMNGDEVKKAALKEKFQSEYDKQNELNKAAQEKKDELAKTESKKQKLIILFVGLGLLLVLAFAGFIFRSLRIRNKQNRIIIEQKHMVEEKQKEITDSITYARRIQYSLLAHTEVLQNNLHEHFILFKPKDIVSGDFYWAVKKDDSFYLAVCDCTGHGVPGAFMSLLSINYLNEAVIEKNISSPDEIFNYVRTKLIATTEGGNDGMDATLIRFQISDSRFQITYACANHKPMLFSDNTLTELASDKMCVGKGEKNNPFTLYELKTNKGDILYLSTDGYADQFGGESGEKKLTRKKFKELIVSVQNKSMNEQGAELERFITNYRKNVEQIDDILVMGVRV